MRTSSLRLYLRTVILAATVISVVGIAFMYGPPRPIRALNAHWNASVLASQTPTAPTPPAACVGGKIAIPIGSDSSYLLAAVQDLMASRSQDECNQTNTYVFLSTQYAAQQTQIASMQAQIAVLQAKLNVTPPPPPTCNAPNTLINGVCTPPTTTPPSGGNPIVSNGKVVVSAGGANQALCQGTGAGIVPAGTLGTVVAGPKTMLGITCWNIQFPAGISGGWTPANALAGQ